MSTAVAPQAKPASTLPGRRYDHIFFSISAALWALRKIHRATLWTGAFVLFVQ